MSEFRPAVIVPPRRSLTRLQRAKLFDAHNGVCVICEQKIHIGESWIDEHVDPREISANDDLSNRGPAHERCARDKTKTDQKVIAKVRRQRAHHLGIKKTSGRKLPGAKDSPWKRRVTGEWVRR